MNELIRALIFSGLLSGTQPFTIMGLLLVMTGKSPQKNGWAFVFGAFLVETAILVLASSVIGGTVHNDSSTGHVFLYIRMALGITLIAFGLYMRRPPKKPAPEIPEVFERLQSLTPKSSFVAGVVLADYQRPAVGSHAIASAEISRAGQFASILVYTLLATGIPVCILLAVTRSENASLRLNNGTTWLMRNRRKVISVISFVMGTLLLADALMSLLVI